MCVSAFKRAVLILCIGLMPIKLIVSRLFSEEKNLCIGLMPIKLILCLGLMPICYNHRSDDQCTIDYYDVINLTSDQSKLVMLIKGAELRFPKTIKGKKKIWSEVKENHNIM